MVDPDPGYRPRRAFEEPPPGGDRPDGADQPTPQPPAPAPAVPEKPESPENPDQPPPLYRDEPAGSSSISGSGEETRIVRAPTFRPRAARTRDDEDATTLLPRTAAGHRPDHREEYLDDDENPRRLLGRRGRLALLVGGLAAVIAVGLAVMYAVTTVGNPTAGPRPSTSSTAPSASTSRPPSADPSVVLADAALLSPKTAEQIADGRWSVALTQRPPATDAPTPACLSNKPAEGEPAAQQEVLRLLKGSGKNSPSALHQAAAYASPQEAAQGYAVMARTLGGCGSPGAYIFDGATVTGLGDQATGLTANVITGGKTQWHAIVLSRSGSVVNLVDAARADKALGLTEVAAALGSVVKTQCQAAGKPCSPEPAVASGPPPLGGDVPGFLSTGDLPPAGDRDESWVATPAESPSESFVGSGCETVTWARLDAETASSRVYLVPSSTTFGLNDIVATMRSETAAVDLVAKIKADLESCENRKLTATVSKPQEVRGAGAQGAEVTGWTSTVAQKSTNGTQEYRVGIVAAGPKVAYTFLNPSNGGYDLTDTEWDRVVVRAGQRMTQVP